MQAQKAAMIRSFAQMLLLSIIVASSATFVAYLVYRFYPPSEIPVQILEWIGYICWGTSMGTRGMDSGSSKPKPLEKATQTFVVAISMVGIFTFVMAQMLAYFDTLPS